MSLKKSWLLGFCLLLGLLSANLSSTSAMTTQKIENQGTLPSGINYGTTLNYGVGGLPWDLDPQMAWDSSSLLIINQVCQGLFGYDLDDPELIPVPVLANEIGTWSVDGLEYTVNLRSGVTFQDGSVFNAFDVVWTFDRLTNLMDLSLTQLTELYAPDAAIYPGTPYLINHTEAISEYTVKFVLNYPYTAFPSLLAFSGSYILPNDAGIPFDALLDPETDILIGTGPYQYVEKTGNTIVMHAYDNYFGGWPNRSPENLVFIEYPDVIDLSQALLNEDVQIVDYFDVNFLDQINNDPNLSLTDPFSTSIIYYIGMNNKQINKTFRQSISFALDKDLILANFNDNTQFGVSPLSSPIPNGILYHTSNFDAPYYNITHAREILKDAGIVPWDTSLYNDTWWENKAVSSPVLTLNYTWNQGNVFREEIGNVIQSNLKEIGIQVNLQNKTWSDFLTELIDNSPDLDLFFLGWGADFNDPSNFVNNLFSGYSGFNYFNVNDTMLNLMLIDGLNEKDPGMRRTIYEEIQRYIVEELMPIYMLAQPLSMIAHSSEILDIHENSMKILLVHEFTFPIDSDADGITDVDEINKYLTDPYNSDSDFDGISDYDEIFVYKTDANNEDTDFDNLNDGDEINYYGSDPLSVDTDNDNLLDGFEVAYGTNLLLYDTDGDTYGDGVEVLSGTDPLNAGDYPGSNGGDDTSTDNTTSDDSSPFGNIPGYTPTIFLMVSLLAISVLIVKKRK